MQRTLLTRAVAAAAASEGLPCSQVPDSSNASMRTGCALVVQASIKEISTEVWHWTIMLVFEQTNTHLQEFRRWRTQEEVDESVQEVRRLAKAGKVQSLRERHPQAAALGVQEQQQVQRVTDAAEATQQAASAAIASYEEEAMAELRRSKLPQKVHRHYAVPEELQVRPSASLQCSVW